MSVLHPPIQEEVTIRKNIALGPTGLGQYFPVLSLPLGLGGVIRIQYIRCNSQSYDEEQNFRQFSVMKPEDLSYRMFKERSVCHQHDSRPFSYTSVKNSFSTNIYTI